MGSPSHPLRHTHLQLQHLEGAKWGRLGGTDAWDSQGKPKNGEPFHRAKEPPGGPGASTTSLVGLAARGPRPAPGVPKLAARVACAPALNRLAHTAHRTTGINLALAIPRRPSTPQLPLHLHPVTRKQPRTLHYIIGGTTSGHHSTSICPPPQPMHPATFPTFPHLQNSPFNSTSLTFARCSDNSAAAAAAACWLFFMAS